MRKNSFFLTLTLLVLTSCCQSRPENIDIPQVWKTPITEEMTLDNPSCFHWWEPLNDPILTSLIMDASQHNRDVILASFQSKHLVLKTMNGVTAEIGKNYIEFRGWQNRLKIVDEVIQTQEEILALNKDLVNGGFIGQTQENEDQINLETYLMQRSQIRLAMDKIIFHLATLVGTQSEALNELLCSPKDLPELCGEKPVGYPSDLICNNLLIKEARRQYNQNERIQLYYNYQKTVLDTLEKAETALTAFNFAKDKMASLESSKNLKNQSYQLIKDLNEKGLKDDRDVLLAYLDLLSEENNVVEGNVGVLISYINLYHTISNAWEVSCD